MIAYKKTMDAVAKTQEMLLQEREKKKHGIFSWFRK
ncbi:hypothetical protein J2Z60_001832 [Lactobacillus colini]|uniref:Uncharacterized protein n=1 Tax=Lactobacillus colini TaxID=1819254 RepID=A0ABS4MG29_9LACO|nr:hypothetical protein [Lactobacillus colini]